MPARGATCNARGLRARAVVNSWLLLLPQHARQSASDAFMQIRGPELPEEYGHGVDLLLGSGQPLAVLDSGAVATVAADGNPPNP